MKEMEYLNKKVTIIILFLLVFLGIGYFYLPFRKGPLSTAAQYLQEYHMVYYSLLLDNAINNSSISVSDQKSLTLSKMSDDGRMFIESHSVANKSLEEDCLIELLVGRTKLFLHSDGVITFTQPRKSQPQPSHEKVSAP